jgi:hypothetical protein
VITVGAGVCQLEQGKAPFPAGTASSVEGSLDATFFRRKERS